MPQLVVDEEAKLIDQAFSNDTCVHPIESIEQQCADGRCLQVCADCGSRRWLPGDGWKAPRKEFLDHWSDDPDEWSKPIEEAFPTRSGSHEEYGTAMKMVGNRRSKGELVALVNWLLVRLKRIR